jgi:hypothetical protein
LFLTARKLAGIVRHAFSQSDQSECSFHVSCGVETLKAFVSSSGSSTFSNAVSTGIKLNV